MNLEVLVATYGYPAILLGTFFEGETVLLLAGFLVHRGYLHMPWVIAAAIAGALAGDQLCYRLGRTRGAAFVARRRWETTATRLRRLLDRHGNGFVLAFRFFYGLRTASPFIIGMVGFPAVRFALLDLCGATVWAIVVATAGYLFGHALELLLNDVRRYEGGIVLVLIALGLAAAWIRRAVGRRERPKRSGLVA